MPKPMDEFALIELIADTLDARRGALEGVGDDGAVLDIPRGRQLVVTTDTLVEGVHFAAGTEPVDVGYKALAVNLSDLAAMGAEPAWFFLSLTLPSMDADWVRDFANGMNELAGRAGIRLTGGDLTSGPLNVNLTACGLVPSGLALTRSGAREGDVIGISGPTGLAARAVFEWGRGRVPAPACAAALKRPEPRLAFGIALRGQVHSCIDISDGLLADLGHIADASGVGAKIELERLPVPPELADLPDSDRWDLQLGGGDDYELCFTAAPGAWDAICDQGKTAGVEPIRIGEITAGQDTVCVRPDGGEYRPRRAGYVHGVRT